MRIEGMIGKPAPELCDALLVLIGARLYCLKGYITKTEGKYDVFKLYDAMRDTFSNNFEQWKGLLAELDPRRIASRENPPEREFVDSN